MSASTILSAIAPVAGAPSPSATAAGEEVSTAFAAMVEDAGEETRTTAADAPPVAPATAKAKAVAPKVEAAKATPALTGVIEAVVNGPQQSEGDLIDLVPAPPPAASDVAGAESSVVTADDAETAEGDIVPLIPAQPAPVQPQAVSLAGPPAASAVSSKDPAETAPAMAPAADPAAAPVAADMPAKLPAEPKAASTPPPASPPPLPSAEPLKVEPPRLDAASRGLKTREAAAEAGAPTAEAARAPQPTPASSPGAPPLSGAQTATAPAAAAPAAETSPLPVLDAAGVDASMAEAPAPAPASDAQPAAQVQVTASALSRATIETTIQIAARIVRQLEAKQTRFDMVLTPEDLGRVEVSLDIDADGQLAARLAFDNPAAAADLRGRADELRRQLTDAGFQLAGDALEFSERGANAFSGGAFERGQNRAASFAGGKRLGDRADLAAAAPAAWINLSLTPDRVDMRV